MNLKTTIVAGSIAIVVADGLVAYALSDLAKPVFAAGATTSSSSVPDPDVNTFQGVEAPAGMDFKIFENDNQTHEQAIETIGNFHEKFNSMVGYGNYKSFKKKDANWSGIRTYPELKPENYRHLAKLLQNVEGAETDLYRLANLAEIAQKENSVDALLYMHRILHDLDYHGFDSSAGDYWSYSEVARSQMKGTEGMGDLASAIHLIEEHK